MRILAIGGAVVAFALAALWLVVAPGEVETATGVRYLVLRWGHSVCWVLIGGAAVVIAADGPRAVRDIMLVAAGVCYAAFILALLA